MADPDQQIRELIARRPSHFPGLSRPGETYDRYKGWSDRSAAALLAVLDQHPPHAVRVPGRADMPVVCEECDGEAGTTLVLWPCSTIRAIAKELGIEVADA